MKADKLVHMANQIAGYFRSYPNDEAAAGIRDHIVQFWTPGMRATLKAHLRDGGAADPLVSAAFQHGPEAESPIWKETEGTEALGQLASDAG